MRLKETLITSLLASIITLAIICWFHMLSWENTDTQISEYYNHEVATNISAHGLRKKLDEWDNSFVIVDVRSEEEYIEWHIIWAISIPAYTDRDNIQAISNERILEAFKAIDPDKEIITYCYSSYCMTSRKIGSFLAENWVYVKHLTVGWNEWRYGWELWNYPHEEDQTQKYTFSGTWAWVPEKAPGSDSCGISWDFGC